MKGLLIVALACAACSGIQPKDDVTAKTDRPQSLPEIAQLVDDSIGWFKTKDFDRLFAIFPEDPNLFLFQPNSTQTVVGGKAFREGADLWRDPKNVYLRHEIRDLRINLSESGSVAWWSALLDDCGVYNGKEACWNDCRFTGVAERRKEGWVITQGHYSFAADQVLKKRPEAEKVDQVSFSDYPSMRKRVGELFEKKQYTQAASILKRHIDKFPENVMANTYNLSLSALLRDDQEMTIFWLEEGLRRGVFFGVWAFEGANWKGLADHPRFMAFLDQNRKQIRLAQKKAQMKLDVVTPQGYTPSKPYPLFIALHGGGENIKVFKPHWISPRLEREFIVAYVQSSQVASMDGYHWQEDAIAKKELRLAFKKIQKKFSVDLSRVYIGGFSSGGYGSIQALLNRVIPAKGFVILCPELPANPSPAQLARLVKRQVKGTLLTTELDQRIKRQKAFADYLTGKKVPVKLVVTPNIGHWYPEKLPQLIDDALDRMMP